MEFCPVMVNGSKYTLVTISVGITDIISKWILHVDQKQL